MDWTIPIDGVDLFRQVAKKVMLSVCSPRSDFVVAIVRRLNEFLFPAASGQ